MADFEREVRRLSLGTGAYSLRQGKGDHEIWRSPITNRNITVDSKIKSRHTANAIMKQAGIDHRF